MDLSLKVSRQFIILEGLRTGLQLKKIHTLKYCDLQLHPSPDMQNLTRYLPDNFPPKGYLFHARNSKFSKLMCRRQFFYLTS